jgi:ribose/xylose/arabinose/galactoside ABC-type transport system permease subunit
MQDSRKRKQNSFSVLVTRFGVWFMILVLVILGTAVSRGFLTVGNILNILNASSYLGIVAAGLSFVLFAGQYGEMSVPMTMAISGVIAVEFMRFGMFWAFLAAILTGIVIGIINGFVVGRLHVNTIIWTLSMNFILEGLVRWSYHGTQIYPDMANADTYKSGFFMPLMYKINPDIVNFDLTKRAADFDSLATTYPVQIKLASGESLNFPLVLFVMLAVMIVCYILMSKTKFGNQLKVVGSSLTVARMSGINTPRIIMTAFITCSICASISGVFLTSLNQVGAFYIGQGYDFQCVTAIILGGMSLAGGRGNMIGVFGGVFTLGLISNILTLIGIGTFTQKMITGVIFVIVVAVNARNLRKLGRDYA